MVLVGIRKSGRQIIVLLMRRSLTNIITRTSCDRTKENISRIGDVAVLVTRGEVVTANTIRGDIITDWVGNIILVSVMPALVVHSAVSSNG